MTKRQLTGGVIWLAAVALAVLESLSNLQTAYSVVPVAARPYMPVGTIFAFTIALWLLREPSSEVDGVLYRENLAHRQKIAALETQLIVGQPREISQEQRQKIALRLQAGMAVVQSKHHYASTLFFPVTIYALSNAPDSLPLARAIETILQFAFVPTIEADNYSRAHSIDDREGLIVLLPSRNSETGRNMSLVEELRREAGQLIVDSFVSEGFAMTLDTSKYYTPKITVLVGRRPLDRATDKRVQ
jgi:hypothetical protein